MAGLDLQEEHNFKNCLIFSPGNKNKIFLTSMFDEQRIQRSSEEGK